MAYDTLCGKAEQAEHGVKSVSGEKPREMYCREGVMIMIVQGVQFSWESD